MKKRYIYSFTPLEIPKTPEQNAKSLTGFTPLEIPKTPEQNAKSLTAFTLVELLITMGIALALTVIFMAVGKTARESAKVRRTEVMIATLEVAIGRYHADTGQYPASGSGNSSLVNALQANPWGTGFGWEGPYMDFSDKDIVGGQLVDTWGIAYNYLIGTPEGWGNTTSYNLWSNGRNRNNDSGDGDSNYGDDIYNW